MVWRTQDSTICTAPFTVCSAMAATTTATTGAPPPRRRNRMNTKVGIKAFQSENILHCTSSGAEKAKETKRFHSAQIEFRIFWTGVIPEIK